MEESWRKPATQRISGQISDLLPRSDWVAAPRAAGFLRLRRYSSLGQAVVNAIYTTDDDGAYMVKLNRIWRIESNLILGIKDYSLSESFYERILLSFILEIIFTTLLSKTIYSFFLTLMSPPFRQTSIRSDEDPCESVQGLLRKHPAYCNHVRQSNPSEPP